MNGIDRKTPVGSAAKYALLCAAILAASSVVAQQEADPASSQQQGLNAQKIAEIQKNLGVQKSTAGQQKAADDQKITIAFDNADVKDVIRWASDLTQKNLIVHPGVLGKKITVVAGDPMTKEEAWQVFLSALQVNGLAVMESDDTVKILPEPEAKTEKIPVADAGRKTGKEDIVVRIVKVKNLAAAQLISLLKPLTPNSAHFAAYPETNTLIIADRAGNIDQIVDIVGRIDQAGTIDIEIIKLEYASAKDVAKILAELVQKTGGGKEGTAPSQALNITSDERSNSILMTGDPVMRMQMKKLIQKLDLPLAGDGNTQVVYLNYITAKDMQPILEGIGGSAKSGGGGKEGVGPQEVEVTVQALEQTNAVVITAPPSILNTMKGVIAKLDVRRKQVLVEALIVEVSDDVSRDLGVFWGAKGQDSDGEGILQGGFPAGDISGTPPLSTLDKVVGGLSFGYLRDGSLRAAIRALENDANANVLSTPTVIALDNEEASILVGESVPFKTGVENRYDGTDTGIGAGTGTGTTPGTRSSLYSNDFVSIDRQDIGVSLKVTPRINQENILTLEIEQKVESISDSTVDKSSGASGASDIITNKREISTTALVRDNETLVLGGLMRDELQDSKTGVPFLSKIPVLGHLFKGTSKSVVKKNLMVFIHPRILHDDGDIADKTGRYYEDLRRYQSEFNQQEAREFLHIDKSQPEMDPWPHDHGDTNDAGAATESGSVSASTVAAGTNTEVKEVSSTVSTRPVAGSVAGE